MLKELTTISVSILLQMKSLIDQITDDDYSRPLEILSGNTVAKHVRHVLEIYDELVNGYDQSVIDYDARKRNLLIEHNREYTLQFMKELQDKLLALPEDKPALLNVSYDADQKNMQVRTTVGRELAYNIEHAIHHMAIMQISVKHLFLYISLPANFGVAFSTQSYLKNHVHTHIHS